MWYTFVSSRKNDGDKTLDRLTRKLDYGLNFTVDGHILKFLLPFMGRKDDDEFQVGYLKFLELYKEKDLELPSFKDLSRSDMLMNRFF